MPYEDLTVISNLIKLNRCFKEQGDDILAKRKWLHLSLFLMKQCVLLILDACFYVALYRPGTA